MHRFALVLLVLLPFCPSLLSAGTTPTLYTLKKHIQGPGQAVRITSVSDTRGGTMTVRRGNTKDHGKMGLRRERVFQRRILNDGKNVTLEYQILKDTVTTAMALDGPATTRADEAALTGKVVLGFRDAMGRWRLFLKRATSTNAQAAELAELEAYENRRWFLDRPVRIGETWTIDPAFVRHLSERDIDYAEVTATATLKDVVEIDGEPTAVLGVSVRSLGSKENPIADRASGVMVSLTGTLQVSLATMLDKRLKMEGSFTTIARRGDTSTTVDLPFKTEVLKTIIR